MSLDLSVTICILTFLSPGAWCTYMDIPSAPFTIAAGTDMNSPNFAHVIVFTHPLLVG